MHHPSLHASSLAACIIPHCMHHPSLHASSLAACIIPHCMHPSLHTSSLAACIIPRCMHHPSLHASSLAACIIPHCTHHPSLHTSSLTACIMIMHLCACIVTMVCPATFRAAWSRCLPPLPSNTCVQEAVWEFDTQAWGTGGAALALQLLAAELGATQRVTPGTNCGGLFAPPARPAMPLPGRSQLRHRSHQLAGQPGWRWCWP